jgi:ABC-2 type transport system ATP-binding protein
MIDVKGLSKDYGNGKGVFELTFAVKEGEVFGYLGPNGAGKTTTIRQLLGFIRPDAGACSVAGLDCWTRAAEIQKRLGYIPGETAFITGMKGGAFLRLLSDMRRTKDAVRQKKLEELFELDTSMPIRRMSKGMKQKLAIVAAFMHDPDICILDEPTDGLDPLMQRRFVEPILEEKGRGKTILLSSHQFEEIERTCDRVGIIRKGKLVSVQDIAALKALRQRRYVVSLESESDADALRGAGLALGKLGAGRFEVTVSGRADELIKKLARVTVDGLETDAITLEEIFMQFYGQEVRNNELSAL